MTSTPQMKSKWLSKLPALFGNNGSAEFYFVWGEITVFLSFLPRYHESYLYPLLHQIKQKQRKCALLHQTSLSALSLQNLSLSCPLTAHLKPAAIYQIIYYHSQESWNYLKGQTENCWFKNGWILLICKVALHCSVYYSFICCMFYFGFARFCASSKWYWSPRNNKGVIHSLKGR